MKIYICYLLVFFTFSSYAQEQDLNDKDKILNNYLVAIGATEKSLDTINSIMTKYKGQTVMGEMVIEKVTSESQVSETYYMAGNILMSVVVTKEQCYQVSAGGEKKSLPEAMCEDYNSVIGLFQESGWLNFDNISVTEVKYNDEDCYMLETIGNIATVREIYSKNTGLKVKSVSVTKHNDQNIEGGQVYSMYDTYGNIKFPRTQKFINFLGAGIDAEFSLVEVKFNAE